jgi:hypothetical protein
MDNFDLHHYFSKGGVHTIKEESSNSYVKSFKDLSLEDAIGDYIYIPTTSDSLTSIRLKEPFTGKDSSEIAQKNLDYAKAELVKAFGEEILDADVVIDSSKPWFNQFDIQYEPLKQQRDKSSQAKADWLETNKSKNRDWRGGYYTGD